MLVLLALPPLAAEDEERREGEGRGASKQRINVVLLADVKHQQIINQYRHIIGRGERVIQTPTSEVLELAYLKSFWDN